MISKKGLMKAVLAHESVYFHSTNKDDMIIALQVLCERGGTPQRVVDDYASGRAKVRQEISFYDYGKSATWSDLSKSEFIYKGDQGRAVL